MLVYKNIRWIYIFISLNVAYIAGFCTGLPCDNILCVFKNVNVNVSILSDVLNMLNKFYLRFTTSSVIILFNRDVTQIGLQKTN